VISGILMIVVLYILVVDICFFLTKKEEKARIVSIEKKSTSYHITLEYYHQGTQEKVTVHFKIKRSYKDEVEGLGEYTPVYYNAVFPGDVYIIACRVPKAGLLIFEVLSIIVVIFAFRAGLDGIKRKKVHTL
jgi:hypothetical protein